MSSTELSNVKTSDLYTENILAQYKFIADEGEINKICDYLISCNLLSNERSCYIYGYGSQPKSTYTKLKKYSSEDYDLLWFGYNGPLKYKILSYIAASSSGLLRVKKENSIVDLIKILSHLAMVGLFTISNNYAAEFESIILSSKHGLKEMPDDFIKRDSSFFYCIIDGDSYHPEKKGFLCETALGKDCPDCLFKIQEFTQTRW